MDPEQENELNQKILDLGKLISEQAGMFRNNASSYQHVSDSTRVFNTTINQNSTQRSHDNEVDIEIANESKRAKKQLEETNQTRSQAYEKLGIGLRSFTTNLLSSKDGLEKYGEAVNSFGQAARDAGKNYGILGAVFGTAAAVLGKLTHAVFAVDDSLLKLRDSLAKNGGMFTDSTTNLENFAISARFSLDNMKKLGEEVSKSGQYMIALGNNSTQAQENLFKLNVIDDSVRRQYGLTGIKQDYYLRLSGLYAEQVYASGQKIQFQNMTEDERRAATRKYIAVQTTLSSLTGKSADTLQKEVDEVELSTEEQAATVMAQNEIDRLKKSKDPKDKILVEKKERELANRKESIRVFTSLYGPHVANQIVRAMRLGFIDSKNKGLMQLHLPNGQDPVTFFSKLLDSKDITNDALGAAKELDVAYGKIGTGYYKIIATYPEMLETLGGADKDTLSRVASRGGQDWEKTAKEQMAKFDAQMNQPFDADPLASRVEQLRSLERESQAYIQGFLTSIDPLRHPFISLKDAVIAAGVALTLYAGTKIAMSGSGSKLLSKVIKPFKSKTGLLASGALLSLLPFGASSTSSSDTLKLPDINMPSDPQVDAILNSAGVATPTDNTSVFTTPTPTSVPPSDPNSIHTAPSAKTPDKSTAVVDKKTDTTRKEKAEVIEKNKKTIELIGSLNVNGEKVKTNLDIVRQYLTVLGSVEPIKLSGDDSLELIKTLASFEAKMLNELVEFGRVPLDPIGIRNNATALSGFSAALAGFKGEGSAIYNAQTISYTAQAFLRYQLPMDDFVRFSKLELNPIKVDKNAKSFVAFADAMGKYTGGIGILDTISTIAGARLGRLFGEKGPIESFMEFGRKSDYGDFGTRAAQNSFAFLSFAKAMRILSGGSTSGTKGGGFWNTVGDIAKTGLNLAASVVAAPVILGSYVAGALGDIVKKIIGVESGGRANAAAKTSSAYGLGQLTKSTFEGLTRQKGSPLAGLTWEQYKADPNIQMKAVNYLVGQEVDFLQKNKIPVSATSVYLAHFLGLGGVRNLYRFPNNTPISQVVSGAAMSANRSVFSKASTVGGLKQWSGKKMGEPDNVAMARYGGTFSGPTNGYPMELHGTEIVIPLDQNSILMKLATQSHTDTEKLNTKKAESKASNIGQFTKKTAYPGKKKIDKKMISALSNKFDRVISTIEATDGINKKILKHSAM